MDDIRINGLTADEWESLASPQQPSNEDLTKLGILRQEEKVGDNNPNQEGIQSAPSPKLEYAERQDYEKLGVGETIGDAVVASGVELSKFFVPKKYEWNYTPRTKAAERTQEIMKYAYGVGGLFMGGAVVGSLKALPFLASMPKAVQTLGTVQKLMGGGAFFKTGKTGVKALGVKALNGATAGLSQDVILNTFIHDEDEGRFADTFGKTNKAFIDWLQSDPEDGVAEAKLKNVIDGALVTIGINSTVAPALHGVLGKFFKNTKQATVLKKAGNEIPDELAKDIVQNNQQLKQIAKTSDLIDNVHLIREECLKTGEDPSQKIIENFNPSQIEDAHRALDIFDQGAEPFLHKDGTFNLAVTKWDDAYKVSPEEYAKQMKARNDLTPIEHQDETVKHTWVNRGWISPEHNLIETTKKGVKGNKTLAEKIVNKYKDKWQIDNKINVEFIDNLTIGGEVKEGILDSTSYLGTTKKEVKQTSKQVIDKKKLQIKKLEDKITKLEGGNGEVSDPLDIVKEELRIAKEELKQLEKPKTAPKKLTNMTIKINTNAKNPYAVLRSELEHARDIAKSEVPDQAEKHFSRYNGIDEAEVAPEYVYKKSVGKAKKTGVDVDTKNKPQPPVKSVDESINVKENKQVQNSQEELPVSTVSEPAPVFSKATTSEEIVEAVTTSPNTLNTVGDVGAMVQKAVDLTPEITGNTWEAICKDAEKQANLLIHLEKIGMLDSLEEAINLNDVAKIDEITRTGLAAQKLTSHLLDKLNTLGDAAPLEAKQAVIDTMDLITRYTKETASAKGRSLNAQKVINKAVETFGTLRLSSLTKAGISELSDILSMEIEKINLNFTTGSIADKKAALLNSLFSDPESAFTQLLATEKDIAAAFNKIIDEVFQEGDYTSKNFYKKLSNYFTEERYDEVMKAMKLADKPETKLDILRNWCDKQGGLTSYYVHNLLSGEDTLCRNILSGVLNTVYFPAKKILAGALGGGAELTREGLNTYKSMSSNLAESWKLCCLAFKNGEGDFSMLKESSNLNSDEVFSGFRRFNFEDTSIQGLWHSLQNFHSIMTRALGASDEFLKQLNYRSIMRAKAINRADMIAEKFGITDEKKIGEITQAIFDNALDSKGKPLNVEALAEAAEILYQTPLDGKIYNPVTGAMERVRKNTVVTDVANGFNVASATKYKPLKFISPFIKTGANILQMNLDHNALYLALSPNTREALFKGTGKEAGMLRAQASFGCMSLALGSVLALNGLITGSAPVDPKERKALFRTGWKPYSIRIGGKFYSYQGIEPIHTVLGFAADSVAIGTGLVTEHDEKKWERFWARSTAACLNNFLDKASFRNITSQLNLVMSVDETAPETLMRNLAQIGQGFLPASSFVKQTFKKGKSSERAAKSFSERMFNYYFNKGLGDYRRDVFGNRQDVVGGFLSKSSIDNSDLPEYQELERLASNGFNPTEINEVIKGSKLKYSDFKHPDTNRSIFDTMQEELSKLEIDGRTLQEAVRDLVGSEEYAEAEEGISDGNYTYKASDPTKINKIKNLFIEYNNEAANNVLREYGELYRNSKGQTMAEAFDEAQMDRLNKAIQEGIDIDLTDQILQLGQ